MCVFRREEVCVCGGSEVGGGLRGVCVRGKVVLDGCYGG